MSKNAKNPSTRGPSTRRKRGDAPKDTTRLPSPRAEPTPTGEVRKGIAGVPGSKNPERRCKATVRSTGERCKRAAIKGGAVCTSHGGAAPQVKKAAKDRLLGLIDPAIDQLTKLLNRDDVDDGVRLRAITSLLDRVGYGPGSSITVANTRFDDLLSELVQGGAIGLDRSLVGSDRPALGGGGGGHPWEDFEQHSTDLTNANFRAQETEDAEPYTTRLDPYDGRTVKGEVVEPVQSRYDVRPARDPDDPPGYARTPPEGYVGGA